MSTNKYSELVVFMPMKKYFLLNIVYFQSITWKKLGYESLGAKDSTLWIGSTGAHTPCHQDLYGINLVAQVYGK